MSYRIKEIILPFVLTIVILVILEIFNTTILPIFGVEEYRLPFNILIILFLGFKLETHILGILVLIVQVFHSFFSVEGWAMGTFAGIIICTLISYLKDLLHFNSNIMTIIITQIFQFFWFITVSFMIYLKLENSSYVFEKFLRFIPESIFISLLAPVFFILLDRIWKVREHGLQGDKY